MRIGVERLRPRTSCYALACCLILSVATGSLAFAAEKTEQSTAQSKETFNLILPFKDLTVGQGQEVTMDAEIVNRTKDPVEVSLTIDGVPKGWDVNFNSRYPSYPIRSVTVAGAGAEPPQPNPRLSSSKLKFRRLQARNLPSQSDREGCRGNHAVRRHHQFPCDIEESRDRRFEAYEPISRAQHRVGSNAQVHGGS